MIGSVHMLGDLPGIAFITFIGMKMRKVKFGDRFS